MIEDNKQEFLRLLRENVTRDGVDKLIEWIETTDFFVAPASTKFHSAFEGGLCQHSLNVYYKLLDLVKMEFGEEWQETVSLETITVVALLHDICKANTYKTEMRNTKVNGEWVQQPYYTVADSLPYGHGEKSVYIVNAYIRLTREEALAINWHMGGFDMRVKGGSFSLSDAFYMYKLCPLLHAADLLATYLDESR